MWILNIRFCLYQWKWDTNFILKKKTKLKIKKSIVNIFVFFIKISCQSKESSLSKQFLPLVQPLPVLEKIFHPHPYCQIYEGRGGVELCRSKTWFGFFWDQFLCNTWDIFSSQREMSKVRNDNRLKWVS